MSEDAHNSNNTPFTTREWQNGKPCPEHGIPYCTPCMNALVKAQREAAQPAQDDMLRQMRAAIIRRIMLNEPPTGSQFYRPQGRNFFEDSRRRQFAASCKVGEEGNYLVIPLEFVIVSDDPESKAWRANDEETRTILTNEHKWDTSTPVWVGNFIPTYEYEDAKLLREFQLFKS